MLLRTTAIQSLTIRSYHSNGRKDQSRMHVPLGHSRNSNQESGCPRSQSSKSLSFHHPCDNPRDGLFPLQITYPSSWERETGPKRVMFKCEPVFNLAQLLVLCQQNEPKQFTAAILQGKSPQLLSPAKNY